MAGPSSAPFALFLVAVAYSTLYAGSLDGILLVLFTMLRQNHFLKAYEGTAFLQQAAWTATSSLLAALVILATLRTLRETKEPAWTGPGKVLLFPARTTHARMFPTKHSFSYSYLVVGVPVGWQGTAGGMVSVGIDKGWSLSSWLSLKPWARRGWYTVNPGDYLERGKAELGLRGKLDAYLVAQVRIAYLFFPCSAFFNTNSIYRGQTQRSTHMPTWLPLLAFLVIISTLSHSGTCTMITSHWPP